MKIKVPKHRVGSDRLISDLIFEHCQRKHWAAFYKAHGDLRQVGVHLKKSVNALKALRTLGYTKEV